MQESKYVLSVKKSLDILDILIFNTNHKEGISLKNLSDLTGIRPNTLHNLLKTMIHCEYVEQTEKSKYTIGPKCKKISNINSIMHGEIYSLINTEIKNLCKKLNEALCFYTLKNGEKTEMFKIEPDTAVRVNFKKEDVQAFYEKPTTRILSSYCSAEELEKIIDTHGYPNKTWNNITNMSEFKNTIEKIRTEAFSVKDERDVRSFSAPIFVDEKFIGAIGCYCPSYRCNNEKRLKIINEMKKITHITTK